MRTRPPLDISEELIVKQNLSQKDFVAFFFICTFAGLKKGRQDTS